MADELNPDQLKRIELADFIDDAAVSMGADLLGAVQLILAMPDPILRQIGILNLERILVDALAVLRGEEVAS